MYTIKQPPVSASKVTTSTWWEKGMNKLTAPELLDNGFNINTLNYFIQRPWELIKAWGRLLLKDIWSWTALTMLEKYDDDTYIYWFWTTVGYYKIWTDTATDIKTDFSTNSWFNWVKYWDFFFVCNWVDAVFRIQPVLWSELVSEWGFPNNPWVWTLSWWVAPTIAAWSYLQWGNDCNWKASQSISVSAGTEYVIEYDIIQISNWWKIFFWGITTDTVLPSGLVENGYTVKIRANSTADMYIRFDMEATEQKRLVNFSVKAVTSVLEIVEVADSPVAAVLEVVWKRLFAWNLQEDASGLIWAEEDSTNEWIVFTNWAVWTAAPDANDPSKTTARHLWDLRDIVAVENPNLGNVVMPIHDNGYYWFDLQINESLEQVTRVNFDKKGNWGNRGINTPEGVFFVNNQWLWKITTPWAEENVWELLWTAFWESVDSSVADMEYDKLNNRLLISVDTDWDWVNDTVIWRNQITTISERGETLEWWALGKYDLWENAVLMRDGSSFFGWDDDWKIYQLFTGTTDNASDISSVFEQELRLWGVNNLHDLSQLIAKWFFSFWWDVDIFLDTYELNGDKATARVTKAITMPASWNSIETRVFKDIEVPRIQRVILRIESADSVAHKLTYLQLWSTPLWQNNSAQN